ncbi:MAG TPA: ribbon-helix-helix protein, CopG family [Chloroflexota bacterium]|jgi:hypothetical protein|nr:ribbon-helix-helix protein, CopG family [Chloroflexota bacterium]
MNRTNIYLEEAQATALRIEAKHRGITRSQLIRQLIDQGLREPPVSDLESDLAAIRESHGVLKDSPEPPPRETGDREKHLAAVWRL